MTTYRIQAVTAVPKAMVADAPVKPGDAPQKLTFVSRVAASSADVDGTVVTLDPYKSEVLERDLPPQFELARLTSDAVADDWQAALRTIEPALEVVLESLAFQIQAHLAIHQLEILDVTPPVASGETREMMLFPWPQGYPLRPFYVSDALGDTQTDHWLNLTLRDRPTDRRVIAARRWYLKGLAVAYQVDRFMMWWIALEILSKNSEHKVEEPWKCDKCQSTVEHCPHCQASTEQYRYGKSLHAFMTDECGIEPDDARTMWKLRQILHGAVDFDARPMDELPRLLQVLRSAVVSQIKDSVGMAFGEPPVVVAGVVSVRTNFGLGGTRKIGAKDLSPPIAA